MLAQRLCNGSNSDALYDLLTESALLLLATCRPEDIGAIVTGLTRLDTKTFWRSELEQILQWAERRRDRSDTDQNRR